MTVTAAGEDTIDEREWEARRPEQGREGSVTKRCVHQLATRTEFLWQAGQGCC